MINAIIDTYHGNSIDFRKVIEGGVVAVIHKATEGISFRDPKYRERRDEAKRMGLLWGCYHFSTGADIEHQVENFLTHALPGDDELISLDWEPSDGPDMTIQQARHFVQLIHVELGRWPCLYGGHLLRTSVGNVRDDVLSNCPLWYARYRDVPIGIPTRTWPTFTLWQYTDGVLGPEPRDTLGVSGADRNLFAGSLEELRQAWPLSARPEDVAFGPGFAAILSLTSG